MDKFDQLNLPDYLESDSVDEFYEYFSEMQMEEQQIHDRSMLASEMRDGFAIVLISALMFYKRNGYVDVDGIRNSIYETYIELVSKYTGTSSETKNAYVNQAASSFADDVAKSTSDHIKESFFTSDDRAVNLAKTQAHVAMSASEFADAESQGKLRKKWNTMRDKKVRETHRRLDGKVITLHSLFDVNGYAMLFPGDSDNGAPVSEIAGCRCWLTYL